MTIPHYLPPNAPASSYVFSGMIITSAGLAICAHSAAHLLFIALLALTCLKLVLDIRKETLKRQALYHEGHYKALCQQPYTVLIGALKNEKRTALKKLIEQALTHKRLLASAAV